VTEGEVGTPQGARSPLLANTYLHYVSTSGRPVAQAPATGDVIIVRYADDAVLGFEHEAEARRFLEDLRTRFAEFSLSLHPDKTRLIELAATRRPLASGKVLAGRNLLLSGLHAHLRSIAPRALPDSPEDPRRPHASHAPAGEGRAATANAFAAA